MPTARVHAHRDNLEFLQWIKRFWDTNYPGTPYDAEARRQGQAAAPPPLHGQASVGAIRGSAATRAPPRAAAAGGAAGAPKRTVSGAPRAGAAVPNETIQALTAQMDEMKVSVDSLEKERDFYFSKVSSKKEGVFVLNQRALTLRSVDPPPPGSLSQLREIEVMVQERLSLMPEASEENTTGEAEVLRQIQSVLYSTEDGFEVPEGAEPALDEEETF